jgi:hypothetical protein
MSMSRMLLVVAAVLTLPGCAAIALPAIAPAAVNAGGSLAKAGTAHTFGGATYRTFSAPLDEVYDATRQTLARLGFSPAEEEGTRAHVTLRTLATDRKVRIDLQPLTPGMTQMRVFVRTEMLGKDVATASELVAQTELLLVPDERQSRGHNGRRANGRARASR